ncbi:UNVERIFIED_CONTAM: hypothetical protein Sradi_0923700 [Sesamum radiatum]|uniref:Uncharacterized protein n=1 Tax=Sesamum radiatum TaxID=300843 RepID=A0AAW2V385_SESRA
MVGELNQPWIIWGDFNYVISVSERSNGDCILLIIRLRNLRGNFYRDPLDVCFEGSKYTWTDHQLWQRLERILLSSEWVDQYPWSTITHLQRVGSDHSPLLFRVKSQNIKNVEDIVQQSEKHYNNTPSETNLVSMNRAIAELQQALIIEEDYWQQKTSCKSLLSTDLQHTKRLVDGIPRLISASQGLTLCHETSMEEVCRVFFELSTDSAAVSDHGSKYRPISDIIGRYVSDSEGADTRKSSDSYIIRNMVSSIISDNIRYYHRYNDNIACIG